LGKSAPALLHTLARDPGVTGSPNVARIQLVTRVAGLVAARGSEADLAGALRLLKSEGPAAAWQLAVLDGLGQGMRSAGRSLARLWDTPPEELKDAVAAARSLFEAASRRARDEKLAPAERAAALRLLGNGPVALAESVAQDLLTPLAPAEVQLAAARMIASHDSPRVAPLLVENWLGYSPAVRREVLEGLFARPERLNALLDGIEQKKVLAVQIEPARVDLLKRHPNTAIRERAVKLLAGQVAPERQKIVAEYRAALDLKPDIDRGKMHFQRVCATCHRLENFGHEVGPDLLATLRNKTPEQLLGDILDPSKEVDPRYLNYIVETKSGQVLSGMIAAESAASVTLRRGEKQEDTILRSQIEAIAATPKSVMPEGLEQQLTKQDLADLIAYLLKVGTPR
jgi:putative heme-binding domain-containing protein